MTHGSLFAGIGGFDLGFERAGMQTIWQVEENKFARKVLEAHWPKVPRFRDATTLFAPRLFDCFPEVPDVVSGGDPCPVRSRARLGHRTRYPDLSGYFLALVGRLSPKWVVRENVLASDIVHFLACLDVLGYGLTAIELNSSDFTGQSRARHFCIGCPRDLLPKFQQAVLDAANDFGSPPARRKESSPIAACLVAHHNRLSTDASYYYEEGRGLRFLSAEEREGLQGFPRGWTAELSRCRRNIVLGNAVTVPVAQWIGKRIMETV